jgi:hypothetical protein
LDWIGLDGMGTNEDAGGFHVGVFFGDVKEFGAEDCRAEESKENETTDCRVFDDFDLFRFVPLAH